jgi:hypothetical protein
MLRFGVKPNRASGQGPARLFRNRSVKTMAGTLLLFMLFPASALPQKELTSDIPRFRDREITSRSYERYEAKPKSHLPFVAEGVPRKALITLSTTAERVRIRKYLSDAHQGLKFYTIRTCIDCHPRQARDMHTVREMITCRQCHGSEPIAGINHYYSSMNPRRRYAFVCSKCHEGASASFATYIVHSPNPAQLSTLKTFPVLFIIFWGMIVLAGGTFLVFLPHTFLWGLREFLIKKKEKADIESD